MYEYKAKVVNVVDGDTYDLDIDLGFYIQMKNVRVRLLDVDTPEKRGAERNLGYIVKDYVTNLILDKYITIKSKKDDDPVYTDSFGRWLASVTLSDGKDLSEILTNLGVNKLHPSYSEDNVIKLKEGISFS